MNTFFPLKSLKKLVSNQVHLIFSPNNKFCSIDCDIIIRVNKCVTIKQNMLLFQTWRIKVTFFNKNVG